MPEHTSFFSYIIDWLFTQAPALKTNLANLKHVVAYGQPIGPEGARHDAEAILGSVVVFLLLCICAFALRGQVKNYDKSVIPDERLSLRTFFELLIGYFYDSMKDMMGPKKAKRYFPLIGTCACFIFFSNFMGLIPGLTPPTSSLNITAGCALVVFVAFNYFGLKENGWRYIAHYAGPVWWMAPLLFPLEIFSMLIRPGTLALRLMLNMAVDHILLGIVTGMVALFVPIPLLVLGTLVSAIQVLVFCLLSSIYITLATEDMEHGHEGDAKHAGPPDAAHA